MGKVSAIFLSLFLGCLMLSSLTTAEVTTSIAEVPSPSTFTLDGLVVSGSAEPGVETEGRVCDPDCDDGRWDPYDFWRLNVSVGARFALSFDALNEPNWVSLRVEYCVLDLQFYLDYHCRFWFETDDQTNTVSVSKELDNVFGELALRIVPIDGLGGDDSRYRFEYHVHDSAQPIQSIFNQEVAEISTSIKTYDDSVCWFDCPEDNRMDMYDVFLIQGDQVTVELESRYDGGVEFDRGILHWWFMEVNSLYAESSYLSYRMNEQDSWSITLENVSTSVYRFKFYIEENSNSGDHFGYSVQFSVNKEYRNLFIDSDEDGYSDHHEMECIVDLTTLSPHLPPWLNSSQTPSDYDSDYVCDLMDSDIDGDGYSNDDERYNCGVFSDPNDHTSMPADIDDDGLCNLIDSDRDGDGVLNWDDDFPSDPLEHTDTDGDGAGNNADEDDDNDGYLDPDDTFPLDANEQHDTDNDGVGDNADYDDDGDGYVDDDEIECLSDPLDFLSIPPDMDWDYEPDCMDLDIDGDGYYNDDEACGGDALDFLSIPPDMDGDYEPDCMDWDVDGDGWDYLQEEECSSSDYDPVDQPSDYDGDLWCDAVDDDDDNDGWLDVDEVLCNTSTQDRFERPDDMDRDGTCDSLDSDIDGDGVINAEDPSPRDPTIWSLETEQSNDEETTGSDEGIVPSNQESVADGCWFECWFDKTFKLGGERLSEATRPGGGDPTTMAFFGLLLTFVPTVVHLGLTRRLLMIYDKKDKASRKLMRRVGQDWYYYTPEFGNGYNYRARNTILWDSHLLLLSFFLLVSRELLLVYLIGFIMYFSLHPLYFSIPEHRAARQFLRREKNGPSSAGKLVKKPLAPAAKDATGTRPAIPASSSTSPAPSISSQASPATQRNSSPVGTSRGNDTMVYAPPQTASMSSKNSASSKHHFIEIHTTQLSKLSRHVSENIMRKEALSDLGKTTLANEVKILRKLQKAGLPYQVLGKSNQGLKNPLLEMPVLGSDNLLDVANRLTSADRKPLIANVASAITQLHSAGVVHRDLKLANIMITEDKNGRISFTSLIDFGLAMKIGAQQDSHVLGGTRPFMHPSQETVGIKAHVGQDWFAFSRIMIVLSGACPPEALDAKLRLGQHVSIKNELQTLGFTSKQRTVLDEFIIASTTRSSTSAEALELIAERGITASSALVR